MDELAREQVAQWPGLLKELCKILQIQNPAEVEMGKKGYNGVVKTGCKWKDDAIMKGEMERIEEKKIHVHLEMKAYVESGIVN